MEYIYDDVFQGSSTYYIFYEFVNGKKMFYYIFVQNKRYSYNEYYIHFQKKIMQKYLRRLRVKEDRGR